MSKKSKLGCLGNIPISVLLLIAGAGYWWLIHLGNFSRFWEQAQAILPFKSTPPAAVVADGAPAAPTMVMPKSNLTATPPPTPTTGSPKPTTSPKPIAPPTKPPIATTNSDGWEKKPMRGIYLSRFQVTNNASEQTIRDRVRYYKSQGINTIIQGVWGNGCTMYDSIIMQQTLGFRSCPNQFQDQWLDWMIDEAQNQGMQVHAYFEKGIKIDKDSPILELAKSRKWLVPGIDKTYAAVDHYVLDVEIPEVANLFRQISSEFVRKYPKINAVQWDDYLGYHAGLPGQEDRTERLTQFVLQMRSDLKKANPNVSFDICHHNPYWAKRYFAADWENWKVDRAFIQVYNDKNFNEEMVAVEQYGGLAIAETQLHRMKALVDNPKVKNILIFPIGGNPEQAAAMAREKGRSKDGN
ncbi:MAG: family 10 glycosylhydrolase [Alkalinema sp. RU_4_3]|nr:family 10 glycosylhydrolase [Alkalinema sp. RU_4_3]